MSAMRLRSSRSSICAPASRRYETNLHRLGFRCFFIRSGSPHQHGEIVGIACIDVDISRQQPLHDVVLFAGCGVDDRRLAGLVRCPLVGATEQAMLRRSRRCRHRLRRRSEISRCVSVSLTSAPRSISRCGTRYGCPPRQNTARWRRRDCGTWIGAPRARRRSDHLHSGLDFAAWLSGRAPSRSRASTDAPCVEQILVADRCSWRRPRQNRVSDTSTGGNLRLSFFSSDETVPDTARSPQRRPPTLRLVRRSRSNKERQHGGASGISWQVKCRDNEAAMGIGLCQDGAGYQQANLDSAASSLRNSRHGAALGYRHALFPASGMTTKVIVACAYVTGPAGVGLLRDRRQRVVCVQRECNAVYSDVRILGVRGVHYIKQRCCWKHERMRRIAIGIDHQQRYAARRAPFGSGRRRVRPDLHG